MESKNDLSKDNRIKTEEKILKSIFKDIPEDIKSMYEHLFHSASFIRIQLEDLTEQISKDMEVNPVIESYDERLKIHRDLLENYYSIISMFNEKLPITSKLDFLMFKQLRKSKLDDCEYS